MRHQMKALLIRAINLLLLTIAIAITIQSTGFGVPVSDGLFQNLTIQADGVSWLVAYLPLVGLNSNFTPWIGGVVVICLIAKEFFGINLYAKIGINLITILTFSAYFAAIIHLLEVTTPA